MKKKLPMPIINKIMLYNIHPVAEMFKKIFGYDLSLYNDNFYPSWYQLWAYLVLNDGFFCESDKPTYHNFILQELPWIKNKKINVIRCYFKSWKNII